MIPVKRERKLSASSRIVFLIIRFLDQKARVMCVGGDGAEISRSGLIST